jgi:hypothetical protein
MEVGKAELSGAEDFGQSRGMKESKEHFIKWPSGRLANFKPKPSLISGIRIVDRSLSQDSKLLWTFSRRMTSARN